jgi:hypothetical protein
MATHALYDLGRESILEGEISWSGDNIKVALVKIGGGHYVVNLATDEFLSIIAGADIIATTANLGTKTTAAGVAGAANTVFSAVAAGPAAGAIVIYKDTGVAGTSNLIAYIDDYAGLPVTPNGSDINVSWPTSSSLIFKL